MPSPLTAHIISLPLTLPRLAFYLKHTLIRTALKNGAVFEIGYVGALGGENDPLLVRAGGAEDGPAAKRNWWAAAREVLRVTKGKGKGVVVSGGVVSEADLRAPRDVANLISVLGLAQDGAHSSLTKVPQSLVLRAQTRHTYRAVLSEPKLVVPEGYSTDPVATEPESQPDTTDGPELQDTEMASTAETPDELATKKRSREVIGADKSVATPHCPTETTDSQKKKRKKNKQGLQPGPG